METSDLPYKWFRKMYDEGIAEIETAKTSFAEATEGARPVLEAAVAAKTRLMTTPFGNSLSDDPDLFGVYQELEDGLVRLAESMHQDSRSIWTTHHTAIAWALDDHAKAEREFLFWGGIGEILHYFRDLGGSLNTSQEAHIRKDFHDSADVVKDHLEKLLSHVIVKVMYGETVQKRMRSLLTDLQHLLVDTKASPLADANRNPFQMGETIVRRQFVESTSHLGFRLFGHITPPLIDILLEQKSESAHRHGYVAWPNALNGEELSVQSKNKEIRTYIKSATRRAKTMAAKSGWPTRDIIEYFAEKR